MCILCRILSCHRDKWPPRRRRRRLTVLDGEFGALADVGPFLNRGRLLKLVRLILGFALCFCFRWFPSDCDLGRTDGVCVCNIESERLLGPVSNSNELFRIDALFISVDQSNPTVNQFNQFNDPKSGSVCLLTSSSIDDYVQQPSISLPIDFLPRSIDHLIIYRPKFVDCDTRCVIRLSFTRRCAYSRHAQ